VQIKSGGSGRHTHRRAGWEVPPLVAPRQQAFEGGGHGGDAAAASLEGMGFLQVDPC
jgi:hypothetical protein